MLYLFNWTYKYMYIWIHMYFHIYKSILLDMYNSGRCSEVSSTTSRAQLNKAQDAVPEACSLHCSHWVGYHVNANTFSSSAKAADTLGWALNTVSHWLHLTDHLYRLWTSLTWLTEVKNQSLSTGFFSGHMNIKCPAEREKVVCQSLFFKNCWLVLKKSI